MSFSLPDIVFIIVIFQLLSTGAFLFMHRKGHKISNRLLAVLFLIIGLNLIDNLFLSKGAYSGHPAFGLWSVWFLLMLGPLLFLYTKSILYRDFRLRLASGWHFLPFLLLFIVTEALWLVKEPGERRQILLQITARSNPAYQQWGAAFIFLQFYLYMFASYRMVGRFRRAAANTFSDYRRTDIRWLAYTLNFFTVIMALAGFNSLIGLKLQAGYWWSVFLVAIGIVWLYVNVLVLRALKHSELFGVVKDDIAETPAASGEAREWSAILERIRGHMEKERSWLDPDLTLDQLATQLFLRPKQLSQAINEGLGENFFEFVNTYRIKEAKLLLTNPADKKITILEVLYQVGFNSKSSFNTVFKKQVGMTPGEFKKKMAGSSAIYFPDEKG